MVTWILYNQCTQKVTRNPRARRASGLAMATIPGDSLGMFGCCFLVHALLLGCWHCSNVKFYYNGIDFDQVNTNWSMLTFAL